MITDDSRVFRVSSSSTWQFVLAAWEKGWDGIIRGCLDIPFVRLLLFEGEREVFHQGDLKGSHLNVSMCWEEEDVRENLRICLSGETCSFELEFRSTQENGPVQVQVNANPGTRQSGGASRKKQRLFLSVLRGCFLEQVKAGEGALRFCQFAADFSRLSEQCRVLAAQVDLQRESQRVMQESRRQFEEQVERKFYVLLNAKKRKLRELNFKNDHDDDERQQDASPSLILKTTDKVGENTKIFNQKSSTVSPRHSALDFLFE